MSAKNGYRLYRIWKGIRARCNNKSQTSWVHYGGRGIKICSEWDSFDVFERWALQNGYNDSLSIDRINNDGDYEPQNCRWATRKEQRRNTRQNRYVTYRGYTASLIEVCEKFGKNYDRVDDRIRRGWTIDDAMDLPKIQPKKGQRIPAPFAKPSPVENGYAVMARGMLE